MSIGYNRLTDYYLSEAMSAAGLGGRTTAGSGLTKLAGDMSLGLSEEARQSLGPEFSEVYDSLQAMRVLNETMRDSFRSRQDRLREDQNSGIPKWVGRGSQLTDMLQSQLRDGMSTRVNELLAQSREQLSASLAKAAQSGGQIADSDEHDEHIDSQEV